MSDDHLDLELRDRDPDRWLSSRFIGDETKRADVVAVYAFDNELARAPKVASNALLGEIRLTWWREVLDEVFEGRIVRRHPTAQHLHAAIMRHDLQREPLEAMIDGRYRELDPEPMTLGEAKVWARETAGAAARVAALILDPKGDAGAAVSSGAAWALSKREMPFDAAEARREARTLSAAAFPAAAHAALALHPAKTELGKRLRLTWAVMTGRL